MNGPTMITRNFASQLGGNVSINHRKSIVLGLTVVKPSLARFSGWAEIRFRKLASAIKDIMEPLQSTKQANN